jgi:hypothetical protein
MIDHLKTLREYNTWRRGYVNDPMPHPTVVGEAIDATIAEVERLRAAIRRRQLHADCAQAGVAGMER